VPPVPMPTVGPPPGSVPPVPMPEALAPVGHKGDKYEPSAVYEGRAREALAEIERLKVGLGRLNAQARQKLTPGGKQYRHNKTARAAKVRELNRREDRIRLLHAIASENAVQAAYAKKYEGIAKTAREADATALKETNTLFDSIEKNITSADTVEKSLYLRAQKVREHASDEENQRIDEAIIAATEAVRGGAPSTDAEQTVDKEIAAVEKRVKTGATESKKKGERDAAAGRFMDWAIEQGGHESMKKLAGMIMGGDITPKMAMDEYKKNAGTQGGDQATEMEPDTAARLLKPIFKDNYLSADAQFKVGNEYVDATTDDYEQARTDLIQGLRQESMETLLLAAMSTRLTESERKNAANIGMAKGYDDRGMGPRAMALAVWDALPEKMRTAAAKAQIAKIIGLKKRK